MKAILVIGMPKSCEDCELHGRDMDGVYCEVCSEKEYVKHYKLKPSWCPLKPMPERKEARLNADGSNLIAALSENGWNECLEELEK